MRGSVSAVLVAIPLLASSASPLAAQWRGDARWAAARGETGTGLPAATPAEPLPLRLSPVSVGVAKWATLVVSAGLAAYGFELNGDADRLYGELEQECAARAERCAARHADGSFADAELEAQYQEVLRLDRRARVALVAGQVGLAASVVLFVLDIDADSKPPDIPYVPLRLGAQLTPAGLRAGVTLPLR